ncbi:MAG: FeoA family protein [Marinirhabdus sp.]
MPTISDLKKGERAVIKHFEVEKVPLKLLEMGCLPGNRVSVVQYAPFRDPLYLNINGCHLAIRKKTAAHIQIELR